jgi:hypothetical protein
LLAKKKKKKKFFYRILLLNADVDGLLLEGHRDEILRLLGGGGAEQHRLPLPTDNIQCQLFKANLTAYCVFFYCQAC